ncbi:MAG: hypothetical protein WB774_18365 [Xanthobacteraceae bacterium]
MPKALFHQHDEARREQLAEMAAGGLRRDAGGMRQFGRSERVAAEQRDGPPRFQPRSKLDDAMRQPRTCYDHFAGALGTGIADAMIAHDFVVLGDEAGEVTPSGMEFLSKLGVDLSAARAKRRVFCRPCLDWTERRSHIGGVVGAAFCAALLRPEMDRMHRGYARAENQSASRRGLMESLSLTI